MSSCRGCRWRECKGLCSEEWFAKLLLSADPSQRAVVCLTAFLVCADCSSNFALLSTGSRPFSEGATVGINQGGNWSFSSRRSTGAWSYSKSCRGPEGVAFVVGRASERARRNLVRPAQVVSVGSANASERHGRTRFTASLSPHRQFSCCSQTRLKLLR